MYNNSFKISRNQQMLHKLVVVDGFPGCGKTMLSPIVSAFERVEIMQYAPLIEQQCELWGLDRVDDDVAESMIKMNADFLIYNIMMGRNTNCRPKDLSSIFRHKPFKHIRRMFKKGDEVIPKLIEQEKSILHLTTHMLLPNAKPLFNALGNKLIFIEVVRHPLYMIIQQEKNFKMFEGNRNQHVRYFLNQNEYTFFSDGWEEIFDKSNSYEKAIYSIEWYYSKIFSKNYNECTMIPFELFVKSPEKYIQDISLKLGSSVNRAVRKAMKKQKVPRQQLSDGPALDIYKRCGWTPPVSFSEDEELNVRREVVAKNVSKDALIVLDELSRKYTEVFL